MVGLETPHTSEPDRQELHALVDHIPVGDLPAARKILRALGDPVWHRFSPRRSMMSRKPNKNGPKWKQPAARRVPVRRMRNCCASLVFE